MTQITLTDEQVQALNSNGGAAEVRDSQGNFYGKISLQLTIEERALIHHRLRTSKGPGVPGERVQAHLQALQAEWDRLGGFSHEYMQQFLEKLRAEDARS